MYAETTTVRDQIDSLYFDKLISLECSWQGTWCDCLSSTTSRASRLAYAGCLRRPWACKTVAITYCYVDITSAALFQCAISGAKRKAAQATTGRGIESTHNTRHFTYTRTLPKQKTRKKRKNNKPFVLPCLKFSHSLSLSLTLTTHFFPSLHNNSEKTREKATTTSRTLQEDKRNKVLAPSVYIQLRLTHSLSLATILITFISSYFYFLWLLVVYRVALLCKDSR